MTFEPGARVVLTRDLPRGPRAGARGQVVEVVGERGQWLDARGIRQTGGTVRVMFEIGAPWTTHLEFTDVSEADLRPLSIVERIGELAEP